MGIRGVEELFGVMRGCRDGIQKAEHSQLLLQHINMQNPHLQFTMEEPCQDGSLPLLDIQVSPGPNNTLITRDYINQTHTDQYLHWESDHLYGLNTVFTTHWHTGLM